MSVGGIGKRGSRKRIGDADRVGWGRCWRRYSWEFLVFSSVPTVGHGVVLAVVGLGFCPSRLAAKRDEELQGDELALETAGNLLAGRGATGLPRLSPFGRQN